MVSTIATGRWTIWTIGLANYIKSIKKKEGDTFHDAIATTGFGLFTAGMIAPGLYYGAVGTVAVASAPFVAAAVLGGTMGVYITAGATNKLEEADILREGATIDYLKQHTNLDTAWENIYNPFSKDEGIQKNISIIWDYYNPFDKED